MPSKRALLIEAMECARKDPRRALRLSTRYIAAHPKDGHGYFSRHLRWKRLGKYDKAMKDLMTSMCLTRKPFDFLDRGNLYRAMGEHAKAVTDFNRHCSLHYRDWLDRFGPHARADSLARLGRLEEALADCRLIDEDHWWAAHCGLPGGSKDEFIAEIRRRAALAQEG